MKNIEESIPVKEISAKEKVFQALAGIPEGSLVSYGQLAQLAGLGKAARFVGSTLRKLPHDTNLPWHRVVKSDGSLAFPTSHPGYAEQRNRLEGEGIIFKNGKTDIKHHSI